MLQRIQTLYMLVAAILTGISPFFISLGTDSEHRIWDFTRQWAANFPYNLLPLLFISVTLLIAVNIFLFTHRMTQIALNRVAIGIYLIILAAVIYIQFVSGEIVFSKKGIEGVIPVLGIILLGLANKNIRNDETLVKSMDRIR